MSFTPPAEEETAAVSIPQALQYAVQLQRAGHLDAAESLYRSILAAVPEHPDALHFLGVLEHQRGNSLDAIGLIRRASELLPLHADCQINLGNVLAECDRLDEAADAYQRALELAPERADIHNNLGVVFKALERWDDAEASYLKALELSPEGTNAYNNLGLLYAARGRIKEAVHYYCRSIAMIPGNTDSRRLLGIAYYMQGNTRKAAEVFLDWLKEEPEHPVARHMYAACSGENTPARAADDYIEHTFDRFAGNFDTQLQDKLGYQAPSLVAKALKRIFANAAQQSIDILDAGCGTGLCGPLLTPLARTLVGVDLSAGMLAKAEAKQCYHRLEKAELTGYIGQHPHQFDAIVSADTLVYFGPLDAVLGAACRALRPGGGLVFTVEQSEPGVPDSAAGFQLSPNGRYTHSQDYLERALRAAQFAPPLIEDVVLRNEGGAPVKGWLVSTVRT